MILKISQAEYDRLISAGPMIDDEIISQFNKKSLKISTSVPSICNSLDKCDIYKIDPKIKMNLKEFIEGIEDIVSEEEKKITSNKKENIVEDVKEDIKEDIIKDVKEDIKEDIKEDVKEESFEKEESLLPKNKDTKKDEKKDVNVEVIINVKDDTDDEKEES